MNRPKQFYYITHRDNLKSILKEGLFSRSKIKGGFLSKLGWGRRRVKPIHNEDVVQKRKEKSFKGRSLWDYVNVYFEVRNPMLFCVKEKIGEKDIVILQINSDILAIPGAGITDGNASSNNTRFFENIELGLEALTPEQFNRQYWSDQDGSKRTLMAEVLIPDKIPKEKIIGVFVSDLEVAKDIRKDAGSLEVIPKPEMFFLPEYQNRVSDNIMLKKGDMFFSDKQTFTISVNTVGIMGRGVASRTKYQFPDVYVLYQDLCRQKKLKMGVPYLYKREANFIHSLMEDTSSFVTENGYRWFLLFPTKNHWKKSSPIVGIEQGLQWLVENYKDLGISSIAMPALGCGLGGLEWKDVGPLMCKYLDQMEVESSIYLPLEKAPPLEQLKSEFLLQRNL